MGVLDDYNYQKRTDASASKILKITPVPKSKPKPKPKPAPKSSPSTYTPSYSSYSSGGGGGGGGATRSRSTTSSTTKNYTKNTDAQSQKTVRELVEALTAAAAGQAGQLQTDLDNMSARLMENIRLAQGQYDATLGTLRAGYDSQLNALDTIQLNTEKAMSEEGTGTLREYARMAGELKAQVLAIGGGETDQLTARIMSNVDRMMASNQSLRSGYDTTASTNQAKQVMRTDALSGVNDLANRLDSEMAELDAAYEADATNRANASYAAQADIYKQIGGAWNQQAIDAAKAMDEAKGSTTTSTTKTKSGGATFVNKDKATTKIKTSMSYSALKKLKEDSSAKGSAALKTSADFAGRTGNIKTDAAVGVKSDWRPADATTRLTHNQDINTDQAETRAGKRVSGSTLKGWV